MSEMCGDVMRKTTPCDLSYYKAEMRVDTLNYTVTIAGVAGGQHLATLQVERAIRDLGIRNPTLRFYDVDNDTYYTYEGV